MRLQFDKQPHTFASNFSVDYFGTYNTRAATDSEIASKLEYQSYSNIAQFDAKKMPTRLIMMYLSRCNNNYWIVIHLKFHWTMR